MLLSDDPDQQPPDGFRDASHHKRHGQADQQDDEGNKQRDAGRAGERRQCSKKRPSRVARE